MSLGAYQVSDDGERLAYATDDTGFRTYTLFVKDLTSGALIAIEALIDDQRRENLMGLLMSLNMLIEFGDAFDYSGADFRGWCTEVGFTRFEVIHLAGPSSAAIAYK